MNATFPIAIVLLVLMLAASPAWPDSLPATPAKYASGDQHVLVFYLRKDGKNLLFEQVMGQRSPGTSSLPLNDQLDAILKDLAEDEDNKDLLFLADPARSTADVNRAIAAARRAGFSVYQSPPLRPAQ